MKAEELIVKLRRIDALWDKMGEWLGVKEIEGVYYMRWVKRFEKIKLDIVQKYTEHYHSEQMPSEELSKSILGTVQIKPECRETHGHLEAYDRAAEVVKHYYKMFATEANHKRTFTLDLQIIDIKSLSEQDRETGGEKKDCKHFILKEYLTQPYGTCSICGAFVTGL